jgi:hypothetical protein
VSGLRWHEFAILLGSSAAATWPIAAHARPAGSKLIGRYGGVTPALSACRRPLHRRLSGSEKPTVSPQRSPETHKQVSRLFRRCDLFGRPSFGFGLLGLLLRGVQEPSDEAGAALLHDLRIVGLLLIVKVPVIFRVAHGILHLLSAPTINQLRNSVDVREQAAILDRDLFGVVQVKRKA